MTDHHHVAIVQRSPAVLNVAEGLARARAHIGDAARDGAELVVFPEAWLGGYPAWTFAMAGWDDPEARDWYAVLLDNSLDVRSDLFGELREAAAEAGTTVVMGFNERRSAAGGSVYNSLATIGPSGELLGLHRKLTPTHTERLVWAAGDARGLHVVPTAVGNLGGLICWEHWHPLARYALHAEDEQVHVALWPDMSPMHVVANRSYAFEGRCFVIAAAQYLRLSDVPAELREAYDRGVGPVSPDPEVCFDGGSTVIRPDGSYLVEPVRDREAIIHATIDLRERDRASHDLDVAGHYGRRDIFQLRIDDETRDAVYRKHSVPTQHR